MQEAGARPSERRLDACAQAGDRARPMDIPREDLVMRPTRHDRPDWLLDAPL